MKFMIRGNEYDPVEGLKKVTLTTLFELKIKYGVSMKTLAAEAVKLEKITDPMDLLDDEGSFKTFMVIIWLARRHAGERLTLEEANDDFGISDLQVITDEPEDAPDPKEAAVSGPDASPEQPST